MATNPMNKTALFRILLATLTILLSDKCIYLFIQTKSTLPEPFMEKNGIF